MWRLPRFCAKTTGIFPPTRGWSALLPYQGWADGLYLVKRASPGKGVDHYAVLDIGNRLGCAYAPYPIILEMVPPTVQANWLADAWQVVVKAPDDAAAIARLHAALANPR